MEKVNIRHLSISEIENFLIGIKEKPFRAKQIYSWLWKKTSLESSFIPVQSIAEMSDIPVKLRQIIEDKYYLASSKIDTIYKSKDNTIKVKFNFPKETVAEGVLIPEKDRVTACISSQSGCGLNCKFCATGKYGFKRNLDYTEIVDQVLLLNHLAIKELGKHITHIVYMGMGEPFLNYENVIKSLKHLTSAEFTGISARRITVSTVGIPEKIKQFADDIIIPIQDKYKLSVNLAISLHSASDEKRSDFVPINKKHSLKELSEAIKYFYNKTSIRITYEYLLLKDINDSIDDAKQLANFCKISPCKINLIEYNNNDIPGMIKSSNSIIFAEYLKKYNLIVNIRRSRGQDIKAACGQLAML